MVAYTLFVVTVLHTIDAVRSRAERAVIDGALWLSGIVILQATLGILTLLNQAPLDLSLAHQAVAILVLTLVVFQAERLTRARREPIVQGIGQPATQTG
jgi:cytochrome c oxidase assembly protein subunit 15